MARPLTWLLQANLRDQVFLARLEAALEQLGEDRKRVEANCFNASGFYATAPATVVAAVAAYVRSTAFDNDRLSPEAEAP